MVKISANLDKRNQLMFHSSIWLDFYAVLYAALNYIIQLKVFNDSMINDLMIL